MRLRRLCLLSYFYNTLSRVSSILHGLATYAEYLAMSDELESDKDPHAT